MAAAGSSRRRDRSSVRPTRRSTQATVDRVNTELAKYGIDGGSGAIIPQKNPLTNIFARIDVNLPYSSRLKLSHNYSDGDRTSFSRSTTAISA